jgi:hypothetical protein
MSLLDAPDTADEGTDATVTVRVDDTELSLAVPDDATADEAAAIATVVGAHLTDQQRAAAAAVSDSVELANAWTLSGKLKAQGKRRLPSQVERGDEWKAAGRSFPR